MQLLEERSGAFNAEQTDGGDSGLVEEEAPTVPEPSPGFSSGVYEGSSNGVPRHPPQKRRQVALRVTTSDDDDNDDDRDMHKKAMHKKDSRMSLDDPLDPEIAAALQACEEEDAYDII